MPRFHQCRSFPPPCHRSADLHRRGAAAVGVCPVRVTGRWRSYCPWSCCGAGTSATPGRPQAAAGCSDWGYSVSAFTGFSSACTITATRRRCSRRWRLWRWCWFMALYPAVTGWLLVPQGTCPGADSLAAGPPGAVDLAGLGQKLAVHRLSLAGGRLQSDRFAARPDLAPYLGVFGVGWAVMFSAGLLWTLLNCPLGERMPG
jgi:hypothetical protein